MTWINAAHWSPSPAGWLLQGLRELCQGTAPCGAGLSGRRIAAMVVNDYTYDLDKRGALESFASRLAPTGGIGRALTPGAHPIPLWEPACWRWSLTITRMTWIDAAYWSPSPAGWLLQVLRFRCFPGSREDPFSCLKRCSGAGQNAHKIEQFGLFHCPGLTPNLVPNNPSPGSGGITK